ncbi:hypothetical protein I6I76_12680 [Dermacoccus nishinomiyaensis]|uniref:hypothetical protein n=1 Tax=Dermacoccus TaxID=57495 RepID=UPI0001E64569|nr:MULTISPECIES: hypothetical protein [Dermacoccus]EFP57821.1 hypothetical protein HMPREF0321_1955 [Dermacoccus sp. Ellin185]QQY24353.1 hypothetical protein I6I76_12680 [Dermacoccus nishinomiyaensis]STD71423.1 Uncharacterised protein [Dermacoccus nishinomiyaensis]
MMNTDALTRERARVTQLYNDDLVKRIKSGDAVLIGDQRVEAVIRNRDLMSLGALVPASNASGMGRPSRYPSWLWVYIAAIVGTRGSQRAAINWLRYPRHWFTVVDLFREVYGDEVAARLPQQPPCRSTVRHHTKRIIAVFPILQEAAAAQWVRQAQAQGCLDPEDDSTWMEPSRGCTVWGDGTVVKSSVRQRKSTEKAVRQADAAMYYECGEEDGNPVYGVKYVTVSTRPSSDPYGRVILRMERQVGAREADQGATMIERIQHLCGGAIRAVAWDGAHRGLHRQRVLNAIGAIPVTPPHGSVKPRRLRRAEDGTDLWTCDGALCAMTLTVEGKRRYEPLPLHKVLRRRRADGTFRWYAEYALPSGLIHRERLDQTLEDVATKFNRAEHLQPFPKGTPEYEAVYHRRPDAESLHDTLDSLFYKGRMIAYFKETQDLAMLSFALGQNAVSHWVYRLSQLGGELLTN